MNRSNKRYDAADDLALLKADGRFAPLPILPSKTIQLGSTVATIGFPDPGLQGFVPKVLAHGHQRVGGAGGERGVAGECELRHQELVGRSLLRRPDLG